MIKITLHPNANGSPARGARAVTRLYGAALALFTFGALLLLAFSASGGQSSDLIVGDANAYYAWLRSPLLDGDLDFRNDFELLYPPDPLQPAVVTARGTVVNKYPPGMAAVMLPGFVVGHAIALAAPAFPADGASVPYQWSIAAWLVLFYAASFWILFRALAAEAADPAVAALLCLGIIAATNLLHYFAKEPAMPHAAGVAVANCALALALNAGRLRAPGLLLLGALLGIHVLLRNTNLFFFLPLGILLLRRAGWRPTAAIFAVAFVVMLAQPVLNHIMWGSGAPISGYTTERFTRDYAGLWRTLLHPRHGLFLYHPLYLLLLLANLPFLSRPGDRMLTLAVLASFALLAVVNGTWYGWWFGDSFGNRAFIETLPFLAIVPARRFAGAGARLWVCATLVILALLNVYLWVGYILAVYPANGRHSFAEAWLWAPMQLFQNSL